MVLSMLSVVMNHISLRTDPDTFKMYDVDKTKPKIRNRMDIILKYFKREKKTKSLHLLFHKISSPACKFI